MPRTEDVDLGLFNPVYGWFGGEGGDEYDKLVRQNSNPNFFDTRQQKMGIPIDGSKLLSGKESDRVTQSLNDLWNKEK